MPLNRSWALFTQSNANRLIYNIWSYAEMRLLPTLSFTGACTKSDHPMKALVWMGPGQLELTERPVPVPRTGELLIRTVAVGLCGTDLHLIQGAFAPAVPPLTLGHEAAGVIAKVPDSAAGRQLREGTRVVVNPNVGCGKCRYCVQQKPHLCLDRKIIGLVGCDGGLADYFVAPLAKVFEMPEAVSWCDGACMDNLANAVHGLDVVPLPHGGTVAIYGCGASGLCFIQLCRLRGALKIIGVDIADDRLVWAERFGCDEVINGAREDAPMRVRHLTSGFGVDLAIEASGALSAPSACLRSTRSGGSVLLFGVYEDYIDRVDFQDQRRREITIYGSSGAPDTFARAVELVSSRQVRLAAMVTHSLRFEGVPAFFASSMKSPDGCAHLKSIAMASTPEGM